MKLIEKLRSRFLAFAHDLIMVPVAWLCAYWLRFNLGPIPETFLERALLLLPLLLVLHGCVFWYFGLYRGVWRFASVPDLARILKAVFVGVSLFAFMTFFMNRMQDVPRSVIPLYSVFLILLLGGPRLAYRWLKDRRLYAQRAQNTLILGAGRGGEMLVRDLLRDRSHGYEPVGFIDDDPQKRGRDVHGVRVLGACERIPTLVESLGVELIIIAVPSATSRTMRRFVEICEQAGVPMRTLPRFQNLVADRSSLSELRDISIEDLLGREPVSLDWRSIRDGIADKAILVTGGGGSIGSELCRQILRLRPARLVIFDNSEFNLYSIDAELRESCPGMALTSILGDIRNVGALRRVFGDHRPDITFHAAAYKHVPLLELNAREAVDTNVFGTRNVALAAAEAGCHSFVLISTDKAVNPANVMGTTKRIAEILCLGLQRKHPDTRFITVRFGNVLDSAGSVVPLFRKQIDRGGPVTVTDAEVKRYFMTIPEACQLILQAAAAGDGGEIYVLDMGEPIKISYLAEQMIRLAGKIPGKDIEIAFVGLRPGEKLFEELFYDSEKLVTTDHDKLFLSRNDKFRQPHIGDHLAALQSACAEHDEAGVLGVLRDLAPELLSEQVDKPDNVVALEKTSR